MRAVLGKGPQLFSISRIAGSRAGGHEVKSFMAASPSAWRALRDCVSSGRAVVNYVTCFLATG
eukprot:4193641-Pyramimonas_sp.AAC.1